MRTKLIDRYKSAYEGLPKNVWLLSIVIFINRSGSMVIPFLSIYFTNELGFSLAEAGLFLSCYGIGAFIGTYFGGKLSDTYSSISIQRLSLILSGLMFLGFEHLREKETIAVYIVLLSICTEMFRPANAVSITHFSTEKNRARAFALNRLAINLGMAIGPAIGGFLATKNYDLLFRVDGVTCLIAAYGMFYFFKTSDVSPPEKKENEAPVQTPSKDIKYLIFLIFVVFHALCFFQVFSTLSVFLKNEIGYAEHIIGAVFVINGVVIVLSEMVIVHTFEKRPPLLVVVIGLLLTAVGLGLTVFANIGFILVISVLVWTLGEILTIPFLNTHVASLVNPRNRGIYMGYFSAAFSIAHILAPSLGMRLFESFGGTTVWILCTLLSCVAAFGIYVLYLQFKRSEQASA